MSLEEYEDLINQVTAAFGLGKPFETRELGGTSAPKFVIRVPRGRFVVRVRQQEFADPGSVQFDHASLRRLASAGLPVPCPQARSDGSSWMCHEGRTVEVLSWVDGGLFREGDARAIHELGVFLARFHRVLTSDRVEGKAGMLREDHPDLLIKYAEQLCALTRDRSETRQLERLEGQLGFVREHLDCGLYASLPKAVIHGDIHPGNVRFRDSRVSAVYDFDYLSLQARVRDVVDALMFFAADREGPLRPDDIRSLTQPFQPCLESARILIQGYQEKLPLSDPEWQAIPLLMRSQWLQIRLRGSRKVPPADRLEFVLNGFFRVIDWLDDRGMEFIAQLRRGAAPKEDRVGLP